MNSMIFLALIGACAALPQGFLSDTPEVQAEKQRFFQLYNAAAAKAAAAPDTNVHYGPQTHHHTQHAAAPVHRFAAPQHYQAAHHYQQPQHHQAPVHTPKWTGPVAATIPAGLPGSVAQVRNTPEVEAAINDFSRAYDAAVVATRATAPQPNNYHGAYNPQPQYNNYQGAYNPAHQSQYRSAAPAPQQPRWTGPVAATIPAGLPGSASQVADTPEVMQAKAHFGRTYQQQLMGVLG